MKILATTWDVFGTLLDWRTTIEQEGCRLVGDDSQIDWSGFAEKWAVEYSKSVKALRHWTNLDGLLMSAFFRLAPEWGLDSLGLDDSLELATVWSRLHAFPDAVQGFDLLKGEVKLIALTNANATMLEDIYASSGLPFSNLISAEYPRKYKPHPDVYNYALEYHFLQTSQTVMCAAHCFDLNAAHKAGMKTALIVRENEFGSDPSGLDHTPTFVAKDVVDLANQILHYNKSRTFSSDGGYIADEGFGSANS